MNCLINFNIIYSQYLTLVIKLLFIHNMTQVVAEYVWIGKGQEFMDQSLRSKIRILNNVDPRTIRVKTFPKWNYDGSSTGQASGENSEVIIMPRAIFKHPFLKDLTSFLVLCDTYSNDGTPLPDNYRYVANELFKQKPESAPWFGLEQEYFIMNPSTNVPLGFPANYPQTMPHEQGPYYCSTGTNKAHGRTIAEEHMRRCLYAGIKLSGINAEVAPGQWEFQVGPCEGIEQGDHMWMARFILLRVAERYGVEINFEPKPLKGNWNGSGCHANYSTKYMREGNGEKCGLDYINKAIEKLASKHTEHMMVYGSGNEERMTGKHETASFYAFSDGVCNRGASVRRGTDTVKNKKGYFEDRRPSSNCDPYLVTSRIYKTTVVDSL